MSRRRSGHIRPLGRLASGEEYYVPIGEMRYDGDRAQCHLCGRWLKMVAGQHTISAHGITAAEYREMFRLRGNVSTAAPATSERKRRAMLEQIGSGARDQSVLRVAPQRPPTAPKWRSLAAVRPGLMDEWHSARNAEVDPNQVGPYSNRKVWWRCRDCGHEWRTSPHARTFGGQGCPACGRRRSIAATIERNRNFQVPRERTLDVVRPDLVQEWHPSRNRGLDPSTVAAGSERRVWWRCSVGDCRREWQAVIGERTKRGLGCPRCGFRRAGERRARADRQNSLGALYPHLLDEWHPSRNGDLDPYTIKPGSERRLWWRCAYCGREWQAPPMSRRRSKRGGCPTCAIRMARGVPLDRARL